MQATQPRLYVSLITRDDGPMWMVKSETQGMIQFEEEKRRATVRMSIPKGHIGEYEGIQYGQSDFVLPRVASVMEFPDINGMPIMQEAMIRLHTATREALPTFKI